jgi:hypothetical protein
MPSAEPILLLNSARETFPYPIAQLFKVKK